MKLQALSKHQCKIAGLTGDSSAFNFQSQNLLPALRAIVSFTFLTRLLFQSGYWPLPVTDGQPGRKVL